MRRCFDQKKTVQFAPQNRSIVRPGLPIMAIWIALAAEEFGKIVSAGVLFSDTRKAIYQLTA